MAFTWKQATRALSAATILSAPVVLPAMAETPADTLIMAMRMDDIITMDPAEAFELTTGEINANVYDRIMMYEPEDLTTLTGGVAESWEISDDGKIITFTIREGLTFHSGNPVRAEDVAWSLQRVLLLDKTPAFIITQFGWNADNAEEVVQLTDDGRVQVTVVEDFSPGLVLNALSAGIGSVVDRELVMEHEVDGDLGYEWLATNSAGSGAFSLTQWNANESVIMEANPDYRHGAPAIDRVIIRHVPEPAAQRLLLEQGDIDIARTLTSDQIAGLEGTEGIVIDDHPKATLYYLAANANHEALGNPLVWEALRYLVDYDGMADTFLRGQFTVHQTFWPTGLWGSIDDEPVYQMDVARAQELLAEAGYPDGFSMTIDSLNTSPYLEIAQSVQQTLGQAGIEAEIIPQDGSALWPKYRARRHELILARWSPDYVDPHSNADSFAHNPDNSEEAQLTGVLAWRNAWANDEINALAVAARNEIDLGVRADLYADLQRMHRDDSPFIVMFQQNEQIARQENVEGFVSGPLFDLVFYRNVTK